MTALFRAEWLKLSGNRWAVTFLVWIFPLGALVMSVLAVVIALLSPDAQESGRQYLTSWQGAFLSTWALPNSEIGRFAIVAFTAIVFAGEYQQGTWKNIITRRPRWIIMLNKFFTLGVFITFAFTIMSVVIGIGSTLLGLIVGHYMGAFDITILGNFLGELLPQMALTFIGTFIAAGYAALAAMISRHVMATIIIGVVATIGEPSTLIIVSMVRGIFKIDLYGLFLMTPSYNINNITMQLNGAVYIPLAPEGFIPFTLLTSWLILIAWVVGLVILSVRIFSRQDITS